MNAVLLQMAALIACGSLWQLFRPGEIDSDTVRKSLFSLVYYLLLPALVLQVMWQSSIGLDAVRISFVASFGIIAGMLLGYLVCSLLKVNRAMTGALMLAAAFPNSTYLGIPVLDATLGHWSRSVAIQYDLFACTPLLFTLGVFVSKRYCSDEVKKLSTHLKSARSTNLFSMSAASSALAEIFKVPVVWAAIVAVGLNLGSVVAPVILTETLERLAAGVVPLMLIALGMSLRFNSAWLDNLQIIMPVVVIQLLLVPLGVWQVSQGVGIDNELLMAVVLEAAMPCMVVGIIFCDRYGLDSSIYAATVTLSTFLSLFTLPLWFNWMQNSLHIFYGA